MSSTVIPPPPAVLNRAVTTAFRKYQLTLKADAIPPINAYIVKRVSGIRNGQLAAINKEVERLIQLIQERGVKGNIVTSQLVSAVVDGGRTKVNMSIDDTDVAPRKSDTATAVIVIDAFKTPRYRYDTVHHTFIHANKRAPSLYGDADDKTRMYTDRAAVLLQRTLRQPAFSAPLTKSATHLRSDHCTVVTVESLYGSKGRQVVFGLFSQSHDERLYLEDNHAAIPCSTQLMVHTNGFFTSNCFVLAEGDMNDDVFHINTMSFPPPEPRADTLFAYPQLNLRHTNSAQSMTALQQTLERRDNDTMIILSDVWTDNISVVTRLRKLLSAYNSIVSDDQSATTTFVLMGSFTQSAVTYNTSSNAASMHMTMSAPYDGLCDIITEYPNIAKYAHFIIVPSLRDAGLGNILPRPPLSPIITKRLRDRIAHILFASNPARILYYHLEIVLFRYDIIDALRRNESLPNDRKTDAAMDDAIGFTVKTIVDQAHLCPLPLTVQPVYWAYDHALRLYPLPHAIFYGEAGENYNFKYTDCIVSGVGSFGTDGKFVQFNPFDQSVVLSEIELE